MIKKISNWLAWLFICVGLFLSVMVFVSLYLEDKMVLGTIDWKYSEKFSSIASVLGFLFTGAGTFAIFITLSKQQEQFVAAQNQIVTQQFETTFFNMLNQLFNIKNSIRGNVGSKTCSGQEFLHGVLQELKADYDLRVQKNTDIQDVLNDISENREVVSTKLDMLREHLNVVYLESYNLYYTQLGHYFRYFYNLVKFTTDNREQGPHEDSEKYIQLIQAQLSNDELGLIFCNSLSDKGKSASGEDRIFNWIERYGVLENIDIKSLLNRSLYVLYPETIFKFLNRDERKYLVNLTKLRPFNLSQP